MLQVKIAEPTAKLPNRLTNDDVAYVLYSSERVTIPPKTRAKIRTGIMVGFPEGLHGRIFTIPSILSKFEVEVNTSIVTSKATSKIHVNIFNHSDKEYIILVGDRIAQMVLEKSFTPDVIQVPFISQTYNGNVDFKV